MTDTATTTSALTGTWTIDPSHSRLGFVARHAMVTKVRGHFEKFEGAVEVNGDSPVTSSVRVSADIDSITTGDEQRDGHLRSADFFEVDTHPTLDFASTAIEHVGGDEYRVTGDLSIRGVSNPVTLELTYTGTARDPFGNERIGFEGATEINRKDWGLTWNAALETGGILVGDKIKIELDISAIRA
jgi:polyisoprenoid-binding protein YceI